MTFREATDRAKELGVRGEDIAPHMDITAHTFRLMRLEGPHGRTPPPGWPQALARAIAERVGELERLRTELETAN
jgi:hypothetical protein